MRLEFGVILRVWHKIEEFYKTNQIWPEPMNKSLNKIEINWAKLVWICKFQSKNFKILKDSMIKQQTKFLFFFFIGLCNMSMPTPPPAPVGPAPPGTVCGSGQLPRYTRQDGFELDGNDDAVIPNVSEQECIKICSDNKVHCRNYHINKFN